MDSFYGSRGCDPNRLLRGLRVWGSVMSKRYGGKFSPDDVASGENSPPPVNAFRNRRVAPSYFRANLLFLAPLPLLFSGLGELMSGDALGMVGELGALVVLLLAPWLLREGMKAEDE